MKSIKAKIFVIVLSGIISASLIVGSLGIFWSNKALKRDSAEIFDLMTQVQTEGLNSMFADVEQSAIVFSRSVAESLDSLDVFRDPKLFQKYISNLRDKAWYIANCTPHVISLCVRFSPDVTDKIESFLWNKKDGVFKEGALSGFPVYDSDIDNSWYYKARLYGYGIWTNPYYNEDINEYVISFGLPVFYNGLLIAVIGMDIDFDDIATIVNSISIYDSGYAFLTDSDFLILYHRKIRAGTGLFDNVTKFKRFTVPGINTEFYHYTQKDVHCSPHKTKFCMTYKELHNGMKLVVSVPVSEIGNHRNRLLLTLVLSGLSIAALASFWSVMMSRRLSKPLNELAVSAKQIVTGNYDLTFSHIPNDELGDLMENFSFMARSLKRQFEYINTLAYFDAMTGVKNKRAFIDYRDEINEKIQENRKSPEKENLEFAVIVFDINNLKYMNDKFGHKAGDILIKNSCSLITKNFVFSSIFRIGGDEFVAVLTGKDYLQRSELLKKLKSELSPADAVYGENPQAVSLAAGLAVYDFKSDEYFQSVFDRADEEMYKEKIAMKGMAR